MNFIYLSTFAFILFVLSFCKQNYSAHVPDLAVKWVGKQILFPKGMIFTKNVSDTVLFDLNTKLKVLCYVDSIGCSSCKLKLEMWKSFINSIQQIAEDKCRFIINFTPKNREYVFNELRTKIKTTGFDYPVCIDLEDSLNKLNHFIDDPRFRCFLLDSADCIILIGNPIQNPKIKDLYIHTIYERLSINSVSNSSQDSSPEIDLGTFPLSEPKAVKFFHKNSQQYELLVDTILTSCECTTATINKYVIKPNETATLFVTYTPDGIGEFYREVYIKLKNEEKPLVFKIRGKVE